MIPAEEEYSHDRKFPIQHTVHRFISRREKGMMNYFLNQTKWPTSPQKMNIRRQLSFPGKWDPVKTCLSTISGPQVSKEEGRHRQCASIEFVVTKHAKTSSTQCKNCQELSSEEGSASQKINEVQAWAAVPVSSSSGSGTVWIGYYILKARWNDICHTKQCLG